MDALLKLLQFISKSVNPTLFRAHTPASWHFDMLGINLENKNELSKTFKSFNEIFIFFRRRCYYLNMQYIRNFFKNSKTINVAVACVY